MMKRAFEESGDSFSPPAKRARANWSALDMPQEIMALIFQQLSLPALLKCETVCAQWARYVRAWLGAIDTSIRVPSAETLDVLMKKYPNVRRLSLARVRFPIGRFCLERIRDCFPCLVSLDLTGVIIRIDDLNVAYGSLELPALRELRMGGRYFSWEHLEWVPRQVETLALAHLGGVPPWYNSLEETLASHTALRTLLFHHVAATLRLPAAVAARLEHLVFSHSGVNCASLFEPATGLVRLQTLTLCNVGTSLHTMEGNVALPTVRQLQLDHCEQLTDATLDALTRLLPNLDSLRIVGRGLVRPNCFHAIGRFSHLRHLRLLCGDSLIDPLHGTTSALDVLAPLQLHSLELVHACWVQRVTLESIARTQRDSLVRLVIEDAAALLPDDLAVLAKLARIRDIALPGAAHLDRVAFSYPSGGGVTVHWGS